MDLTQNEQILQHMLRGHVVSHQWAEREAGSTRVAARIHELKSMGFPIVSKEWPVRSNGKTKRVAIYSLDTRALGVPNCPACRRPSLALPWGAPSRFWQCTYWQCSHTITDVHAQFAHIHLHFGVREFQLPLPETERVLKLVPDVSHTEHFENTLPEPNSGAS